MRRFGTSAASGIGHRASGIGHRASSRRAVRRRGPSLVGCGVAASKPPAYTFERARADGSLGRRPGLAQP
ncbi:hypothetical protein QOU69_31375, partial [Burkholderia pseudomallei]|nr:hypothetical protein [Burkholderia pseudomallei]